MSSRDDVDSILRQVQAWPPGDRASLAHAILGTLTEEPRGPKPTLEELVGVGRGTGAAPSDEQVKQWIDEYRMRKYG